MRHLLPFLYAYSILYCFNLKGKFSLIYNCLIKYLLLPDEVLMKYLLTVVAYASLILQL